MPFLGKIFIYLNDRFVSDHMCCRYRMPLDLVARSRSMDGSADLKWRLKSPLSRWAFLCSILLYRRASTQNFNHNLAIHFVNRKESTEMCDLAHRSEDDKLQVKFQGPRTLGRSSQGRSLSSMWETKKLPKRPREKPLRAVASIR